MEDKSSTFSKMICCLGAIIIIFIIIVIANSFYVKITDAIILANKGVSATATLLEYKPLRSVRNSWYDYYLISYDKYTGIIELQNGKYLINSTIPVVYDKNNPKLVWWGESGMNVWDLYHLNTHLGKDICLLIFIGIGCRSLSLMYRK